MKKVAAFLAILLGLSAVPHVNATVSNTTVETVTALGDGSTTNFTISFDFRDNTWITVTKVDTSTTPPTYTNVLQGSGSSKFTITGGNPGTTVVMGTAPTTSQKLVIQRTIPLTQQVSFDATEPFPLTANGNQLDYMTLQQQNFNFSLGQKLGLQPYSLASPVPILGDPAVGGLLAYDTADNNINPLTPTTANQFPLWNGSSWGWQVFTAAELESLLTNVLWTGTQGGTGVSNAGTLSWGSNNLTFTLSGSTNVTLPAGSSSLLVDPTVSIGDTIYRGSSALAVLSANTTSTKKFLCETGTGSAGQAPVWCTIVSGDVPTLNQNTTGTAGSAAGLYSVVANAGSGGTGANQLAIINSSGNAVKALTTSVQGVVGIVTANAGTTGSATITQGGVAGCVFDGATTAGDYVQASTTTAGDCHDTGSNTTPTNGSQTLGQVETTNGSGGTYNMVLSVGGGGGGIGTPVSVANGGTGLSSGTSGGVLGYTASGTLASSAALTANQLVIGGGAGATPTTLAAGSQYQSLVMGASNPAYGAVPLNQSAAVSGQLAAANGGLGISTSGSTGVPSVSSGTWSIGSTLSTSLGGLGINAGSSTGAVFMSSGSTTVSTLPYSAGGTNAASQSAFQANASPLTTKGDVATYSTLPTRIAVPGDYGDLVPDSGATTGWRADSYTAIQHGRPGKNYIQYADFENSATTGWTLGTIGTLTNGLPTGTPTFGSGASGNLSLSTVAGGTALAGTHSLSYVSSAATTQGNMMASSSYAVDQEDEAKVMTVKFYYQAATLGGGNFSGTSSNSYAWAAYDVTNSVWLSSAGNFCMTQSSGTGYCTGTFQTAATTANFRLVLYNANATTGAATTYFDDFYVGPQTAPMGPAITDWVAYTPTIVGFGSTTGVNFWSRRFGDSLEVHGYFTAGTTTSTTASITLGYNGANANVSTDTTKSTAGQYVGHGTSSFSSSTFFNIGVLSTASTTVNLGVQSSTAAILTAALGTSLASTGQVLDFMWRVPIVGWSSNTAMSSDTDTRVVALDANAASSANLNYNAGSPNSTVPTSAGQIVYGTTVNDTHGAYNSTTGVYTIPVTGWYAMTASYIAGATTTHISDSFAIQLYNATTSAVIKASAVTYDGAGASGKVLVVTAPATYLTAGTQVYVRGLNSGSTTPVYSAGATYNYISISRVSGPAVVAATESVNMRYHAASTSISGSAATITYTTADFDSHNAYASGTYTVPVSGKYQVNAYAAVSGTFALNSTTTMALQKNGSDYAVTNNYAGGVITNSNVGLSDTVNCLAGDTLRIQLSSSATGPAIVSSNTKNWLSIERVGN